MCKTYQTLVTPQHLKTLNDIQKVPDLSGVLREGFELQKIIQKEKEEC